MIESLVRSVLMHFWIKLKEGISYSKIAVVGILISLMVVILSYRLYQNKIENCINSTRAMLFTHRREFNMFLDLKGHYPQSLNEFWRDIRGEYASKKHYIAFKYQSESNVKEYRELNGQGGYYYNPDTGDIKLNFTKPVKEYFFWYGGKYADEIPSFW